MKQTYIENTEDVFKKIQDMFSLPEQEAKTFVDQLFDPDATELTMKDAQQNVLAFPMQKHFIQHHTVDRLEDFQGL